VAPDEAGHFICLGPQCDASFATSRELEGHIKELHTHTCNWAGCAAGSFGTSEELVAHVKREHLLVCPVAECHEALGSRKLVGSHMAVKHPEKGPDAATGKRSAEDDGQGMRRSKQIRVGGEKKVGGLVEDKKLSEYLSVNVWKRRCGEKLKGVLEKRARRVGGGMSYFPLLHRIGLALIRLVNHLLDRVPSYLQGASLTDLRHPSHRRLSC